MERQAKKNGGQREPQRKKQVVFILVETQRADLLSCYGGPLHMPNLDRLAEEGTVFEQAHTVQPVCGPARAALFTGLYPHSNGSWGNSMAIGDNVKTIAQRLRDGGVRAACIGKWHVDGGDYFGLGRCPDGWDPDYWYDMRCYLSELTEEERVRSRRFATMLEGGVDEAFTYAHRCSDKAVDYLEKHGEDDFFLTVSYDEPHGPYLCPEPWCSMYRDFVLPESPNWHDTLENKPAHHRLWAESARTRRPGGRGPRDAYYFGCNSFVDHEVGRVLEAVRRFAPEATVIYTADHGEMLGAHGLDQKGPATYEEITRVPFLVKGPGIPAGRRCSAPLSHISLVPTVLELMGQPPAVWCDGRSAVPLLCGGSEAGEPCIFMEFGRYEIDHDGYGGFQPLRCAFDGRYKLTVNLLTGDELYDLETDPYEMENRIGDASLAAVRDRLHNALLQWMNDTRDPFRGCCWECRPWRTDAAKATWEYTGYTRQRENEDYEPRQLEYATGLPMKEAVRKL